jgi:hypothetical protein
MDCHDGDYKAEVLFAPRLDQLLAMIEAEGYLVDSMAIANFDDETDEFTHFDYTCRLYKMSEDGFHWFCLVEVELGESELEELFIADTREDACALAVLYILRGDTTE